MRWLAVIFALPGPALACPTAADMQKGVVVAINDGTVEVHRSLANDLIVVDVTYPDGDIFQNTFLHGVFINTLSPVEGGVIQPTKAWTYQYQTSLPPPAPNTQGSFRAKTGSLIEGFFDEDTTYTWGPMTTMQIGACRYQMIEGRFSFVTGRYRSNEVINYLPELGTSFLMEYSDDEGERDVYEYSRISAR